MFFIVDWQINTLMLFQVKQDWLKPVLRTAQGDFVNLKNMSIFSEGGYCLTIEYYDSIKGCLTPIPNQI